MKRITILLALTLVLALAARPVMADVVSAKAGSGGVTINTFVKLSAAGTVVTATAVGDSVVGVCRQTAAEGALTSYATAGEWTAVNAGEAVAVGDLVTAGASGEAYVLDDSDASDQQVAGKALTADDGSGTVTVIVCYGSEQSYAAPASLVIGGGYGDTGCTIATDGNISTDGALLFKGGLTITNTTVTGTWTNIGTITTADLNGGTIDGATVGAATPAAGKFTTLESTGVTTLGGKITITTPTVTGTWTKIGTITTADLNGGTIDGATVGAATPAAGKFTTLESTGVTTLGGNITITTPTVTGTWTNIGTITTADINGGTIDGATIGGAAAGVITGTTITGTTFTDGTATITAGTATGLTIPATAPANLLTVTTTQIGVPFIIYQQITVAGTYQYTVPTGKKLRVLDAWGWKIAGNGAHGDDQLAIQKGDGSPANIFAIEELTGINDGIRFQFDTYDDAEGDLAATNTLDIVAGENATTGVDCRVYILCVWVAP